MNGETIHPIELVLVALAVLLAVAVVLPFCVNLWREGRQSFRDWHRRKLHLRGPR